MSDAERPDPGVVVYGSQEAMRGGPRAYTPDEAAVFERAERDRRGLPEPALPFEAA